MKTVSNLSNEFQPLKRYQSYNGSRVIDLTRLSPSPVAFFEIECTI